MSTRIGPTNLPAAPPRSPLRVEAQRGAGIPAQRVPNSIAERGFSREVNGQRFCDPSTGLPVVRQRVDPWAVLVWFGVILATASLGLAFLEFALKPLLGLALDFFTWLGIAAPH